MSLQAGFSGTSSGGVLSEMIALGAMEAYLIKGATVSFFRFRYSRHTNFAMEPVFQNFNTQVSFGREAQCVLSRTGDLVSQMYVVAELPGIAACASSDPSCSGAFAPGAFTSLDFYPSLTTVNGSANSGLNAGQTNDNLDYQNDGTCPNYVDNCSYMDEQYWQQVYSDGSSNPNGTDLLTDRNQWLFQNYGARQADYAPEVFSEVGTSIYGRNNSSAYTPWVHWHNAVGQKLIERAALIVGGHLVDQLYSDYLYMWEELSGKPGKRLTEMIGKRTSRKRLIKDAAFNQRLWIPLPFSFTQHSGNALSLVTLQYHGVQINVKFEALQNLIVKSSPSVQPVRMRDYAPISDTDLVAYLDTTYIYLDMEERDRFATANYDQLITQVQVITSDYTSNVVDVNLNFNHPVIELIWAARRKCKFMENNSFNYSGKDGRDPIESVILLLNNQPRFQKRPGQYFRLVQPYQHHTNIPSAHIYCYSFALHPEEPQPTGACNFSRIDNAHLIIELQQGLETESVTVIVFARNHQIMRFIEGVGGSLFNA